MSCLRQLGEIAASACSGRPRRARRRPPAGRRPAARARRAIRAASAAGTFELGLRPFGGQRGALRQRQRAAAVDHARQCLLAEADVVEQAEADLAGEAGALGDAGEERRQRRFPGSRHHQRACRNARRRAAPPAPGAGRARVACAADRRRCPSARRACSRAAARTASWSGRRPAGAESAPAAAG